MIFYMGDCLNASANLTKKQSAPPYPQSSSRNGAKVRATLTRSITGFSGVLDLDINLLLFCIIGKNNFLVFF